MPVLRISLSVLFVFKGRAAVYEGDVVPFEAAALGTVRRVSPLVPGNVTAGGEPRGAHRAAVRGDAHRAGLLAGVGPLVLGVADGKEVAMGPDTPGDTDDGSTSASASTPQTDHSSGSTEVSEGSEGDVADGHGVEMGYSDGGTTSAAYGNFDMVLGHLSRILSPPRSNTRRVTCSLICTCASGADWRACTPMSWLIHVT